MMIILRSLSQVMKNFMTQQLYSRYQREKTSAVVLSITTIYTNPLKKLLDSASGHSTTQRISSSFTMKSTACTLIILMNPLRQTAPRRREMLQLASILRQIRLTRRLMGCDFSSLYVLNATSNSFELQLPLFAYFDSISKTEFLPIHTANLDHTKFSVLFNSNLTVLYKELFCRHLRSILINV